MTELEQAIAFREEAKQILTECKETMRKTTRFSDKALANQRRLALAMSSLLPVSITCDVNGDLDEEDQVATFATDIAKHLENREIYDIVHAINVLAMANTDVIHIKISFSGHVNAFGVNVTSTQTDYHLEGGHQQPLLYEYFYLDKEDALKKLLAVESQLTELIIDARDAAETSEQAEVEA